MAIPYSLWIVKIGDLLRYIARPTCARVDVNISPKLTPRGERRESPLAAQWAAGVPRYAVDAVVVGVAIWV